VIHSEAKLMYKEQKSLLL